MKEDGVVYIPEAIVRGASRVVVARDVEIPVETERLITEKSINLLRVDEPRRALAELSAEALNFPARKLHFIVITGTKGKTTTAFLTEYILRFAGIKTALLSTVYNSILGECFATKLTTEQPDYLHVFFDLCVKAGVSTVVFEVAAQAFTLYRVHGIQFDLGIFTNFSREHGEFYQTQEEYFRAKTGIVAHLRPDAPLLYNEEDSTVASFARSYPFSQPFSHSHLYRCPRLVGKFNAYNVAAATRCAELMDISALVIQEALNVFPGVPGRLDRYNLPNGAFAFIDYAHNPASFEAVLSELRGITDHLIVLFGAGGERDVKKRPLMGAVASHYADLVIITSDNPRSEDPVVIADQIQEGIAAEDWTKVARELDREKAIQLAYKRSGTGSIIVLLGKGPDEYQIVDGVTYPFSERSILLSLK